MCDALAYAEAQKGGELLASVPSVRYEGSPPSRPLSFRSPNYGYRSRLHNYPGTVGAINHPPIRPKPSGAESPECGPQMFGDALMGRVRFLRCRYKGVLSWLCIAS
jgi:hypothetical protein